MRLALKILALLIFGPLILGLLLILGIVAMIGIPLLWEQLTARLTRPPQSGDTSGTPA